MNIHTLFHEHQKFNIYGKISKLNIDFHHSLLLVGPALDTLIVPTRRRYKVVAEQYCKISPLICMVCLFFKL